MNYKSKSSIFSGILLAGFAVLACQCNMGEPKQTVSQTPENDLFMPKILSYTIKATYPHDPKAFTQGLIWHNGQLVEGTGMEGESNLRKVTLENGKVTAQVNNTPEIFGEGVTYLNGKFYQITWQNNKGFVYDAKTLNKLQEFPLNTEGWGLTTNGVELIVSDGSSNIYFLDTATFREKRRIGVSDNFGPVSNLNELEWVNGHIWANRLQSDIIYKIEPESGRVVAKVDFSQLKQQGGFEVENPLNEVLNGIAYDSASKRFFITGKYWPKLFEVEITE